MRSSLVAVAVIAAAGGCRRASNLCPEPPQARFRGGGPGAAKLHPKLVSDMRSGLPRRFPMVLVIDVVAGADPARLRILGADEVRPVNVTEREPHGVRAAKLERGATATAWLVHAPVELLPFLAELPWVTAVAPAIAWPSDLDLPEEAGRRIDPTLHRALRTYGDERPFSVGGLGKATGCLDAARREELARLGAIVTTTVAAKECASTIFSFEMPLGSLTELAALPWIVTLEGSRPMYPE